jgi:cell division septal protein FtsQ
MAVKAPEDKRFRRSRVKPASRRHAEALHWTLAAAKGAVLVGAIVGLTTLAGRAVLASARFTIENVLVTGNHRLSDGEVTALLEGLRGQHILRADLGQWRARLLESPWVSTADVRRSLPATIEVVITERHALGIGRLDDRLYLLDEQGEVIDDYGPDYADLDLPIVDGLMASDDAQRRARATLAGRVLDAVASRRDLAAVISQVDVSDPRDAVAILDNDPARLHLGDRDFVERLRSYLDLKPALQTRVPAMDYVDLRFDSRVFVRPAADAALPPAADSRAREAAFR